MLLNKKINNYLVKSQVISNTYIAEKDHKIYILKAYPKISYIPILNPPSIEKHSSISVQIQRFYLEFQKVIVSVTPYFSDGNLLTQLGKLNAKKLKSYIIQICEAVLFLHKRGFYHQHLNLSNIFIKKDQIILSIEYHQQKMNFIQIKNNKQNKQNQNKSDKDIYDLGIILFELISTRPRSSFYKWQFQSNQSQLIVKYLMDNPLLKLLLKMVDKQKSKPNLQEIINNIKAASFEWDFVNSTKKSNLFFNYENLDLYKKSLKSIKQLNVSFSQLSNVTLQGIIRQNNQLKILNISNSLINDDCGIIIAKHCKNLKILDASGNNINDNFVKHIKTNVINLQSLDLCFTDITDIGFEIICNCMKQCESLNLSYTKISTYLFSNLQNFKKLKRLYLWSGSPLLPQMYAHVYKNIKNNYKKFEFNKIQFGQDYVQGYLKLFDKMKLEELALNLQNQQISNFKIISSMKSVQLGGKFSEALIKNILSNQNLERVLLTNIDLNNQKFSSQKLKQVSLCFCKVDCSILNSLNQSSLQYLDLQQSKITDSKAIKVFSNPHLKYLNLDETRSNDEFINKLLNNTNNQLEYLDLNWTKTTDEIIEKHVIHNHNLIYLDIAQTGINDSSLNLIANNLQLLRYMSLQNNHISNKSISTMLPLLNQIEYLNLKGTNIDDFTIKQFSKKIKDLYWINLNGTQISDNSIDNLMNFKYLNTIFINDTKVTFTGRQKLRKTIMNVWGTNTVV